VQASLKFGDAEAALVTALWEALKKRGSIRHESIIHAFAEKYKMSGEDAEAVYAELSSLDPFPGRRYDSGSARYISPDIRVERKTDSDGNNTFHIVLNNEEIPVLGIQPYFLEMENQKGIGKNEKAYIDANIKEARWFIDSINMRNHTLLRLTRCLLVYQRAFFEKGPFYIAPLTQRTVAESLKLHETTISRAARGKYIETEWGLFEIRKFFTNSVEQTVGKKKEENTGTVSKEAVKTILQTILQDEENTGKSDAAILKILEERGVHIARRTVAKYRKELRVGSSYER
jgi:RNA polymerase sigma-54 factor